MDDVSKTNRETGFASSAKVFADVGRAMITSAPPASARYAPTPEDLLSALLEVKKNGQLLLDQNPDQRDFILEILRPEETAAKQRVVEQEQHFQKLSLLLDEVIDRMEKAEQACRDIETRWMDAEQRLWKEKLRPDSRDALERVLIAAIAHSFGLNELRWQGRTSIASDLERVAWRDLRIQIDPKTVRRYVNQAIERYVR